ncbi:thiamine pyrophosphate-binding protein [Corynebacterium suedekumii]|nr:thiamine pyrophosphate-binding protein [Corynebacterium suedekumii]
MGNGNAWLIDALPTAGIAVVPVRHEAATVAAADAYGRASRRLAVATTTYGPGFTNALTPLAEAALARTPCCSSPVARPPPGSVTSTSTRWEWPGPAARRCSRPPPPMPRR